MTCNLFQNVWSWQAAGVLASTSAVVVALFGDFFRRIIFRPKISIQEFPQVVPDQTRGGTQPVLHHHYLEILHDGSPIEAVRVELLAVTFFPGKENKERFVRMPGVSLELGSHLVKRGRDELLRSREVLKLGQIASNESIPTLTVDLEPRHNPVGEHDTDPHYRGRFYLQIVGKHYRSAIWSVDFVRDGTVTSGWRLDVIGSEKEKSFWSRTRNYVREHNEWKRKDGLP